MDLNSYIRDIADFPKPGIRFKDITPLMGNREAFAHACEALLELVGDEQIDKVVGIESRGYFFGGVLAQKLHAGFVPIRKPGKLPFDTEVEVYDLEYGKDTLEIHSDAIVKGDRVLLHDDVLATGGTASAAIKLIEKLGGIVVQCNFLIELDFLQGRNKLRSHEIASLLHY